jgi:D-alanyl-lipoteichoic acid acyltransferase DltB (MBOAT superfamily)
MLFNSYEFLCVFLPLVLIGYAVVTRVGRRGVITWLAASSIAFYGYWKPAFLLVLASSILANYFCSRLLVRTQEQPKTKRLVLVIGITANLLLLGYYKYLFSLLSFLTDHNLFHLQWPNVLLPLGISFFTFTQIGYLVDLSQGQAAPQPFINYVLFVTFFPHLIAGPLFHHSEVMPQFAEEHRRINTMDLAVGVSWFIMGLFKKVAIADYMAVAADEAFADPHSLTLFGAWAGVLSYAIQLYFDFSGYSDMAIGLARMFSIEFPLNFNSPYRAQNIGEFWQRWHMTLTRYLTLYLYNPMALWVSRRRLAQGKKASRKAAATPEGFATMVAFPTLTTMFLAGIWHGAGIQFLIFGLLHGCYLSVHQAWNLFRQKHIPEKAPRRLHATATRFASVLLTFLCVLVGQIFFRAASTSDAFAMLASMAGAHGIASSPYLVHLFAPLGIAQHVTPLIPQSSPRSDLKVALELVTTFIIVWGFPNTQEILGKYAHRDLSTPVQQKGGDAWRWKPSMLWAVSLSVVLLVCLLLMQNPSRFLYFQF